ncbi:Bug family tripartite tricarboxylate transporter substrate binding protein [Cupriavidus sp. 2TAF22]|uniref:Bug family tripartite tricarboxylate transporter substrate binding protein n=1 Tax=unclassified Cupriavidus TaxID=2640874 RepID=UPI003F8DC50F
MKQKWAGRAGLALSITALTAAALVAGSALAQDKWPSRPIRLVVPSPGGSGPDVLARVFAEQISQALKQPVVVDNKPGANGQLSVDTVVRAQPDGYTVLFASASATVMNQAIQPKLPYDIVKDLVPVAQIGAGGVLLVVTPDFPAKNVKEFVATVKASPGKYDYGSWGVGSGGHLAMAQLRTLAGLELTHVPYKGVPPIMTDLQGGVLKVAFVDITTSVPLVKSGKIRALGITGKHRAPAYPDVPTMAEQGFPMRNEGWYGVFVPKGTPRDIVAALNTEINKALRSPTLAARFQQLNMMADPPLTSPDEFARTVRNDYATWADVVKANGIKPE